MTEPPADPVELARSCFGDGADGCRKAIAPPALCSKCFVLQRLGTRQFTSPHSFDFFVCWSSKRLGRHQYPKNPIARGAKRLRASSFRGAPSANPESSNWIRGLAFGDPE
jgi:hypothetical protein